MKTKTYHISNFGAFAPNCRPDSSGYLTIHDSPRYEAASDDQLECWAEESRISAVRAAAETEIAERNLAKWQKENS